MERNCNKMKICKRALDRIQVIDEEGTVRICGWNYDGGVIGKLSENTMEEIYNSDEAKLIRNMHINKDYSNCNPNACPYVACGTVEENSIEIEEIPRLPRELHLAYENICNYRCVTCTIPDCMENKRKETLEEKYKKIDSELMKVLPYVHTLGANGLGEFFVSPHTMNLMQNWNPVFEDNKCSAHIETNGSLFNEKNWSKVDNLARFNLSVSITVMSFEEGAYQNISGTRLPVSNIIDNLKFVKFLREKGIINHLELATVYQMGNFRTLPEFTRRCIEEFGADYVRLRPFEPWVDPGIDEWMRDVRNVDNPFHKEFLEVMKDPVFKHPKVHDWGGGKESGLGKEIYPKAMRQYRLIEEWLNDDKFIDKIKTYFNTDEIVVYGLNTVGKFMVKELHKSFKIPYLLDRGLAGGEFDGIRIEGIGNLKSLKHDVPVIMGMVSNTVVPVEKLLRDAGYTNKIIPVMELKNLIG